MSVTETSKGDTSLRELLAKPGLMVVNSSIRSVKEIQLAEIKV